MLKSTVPFVCALLVCAASLSAESLPDYVVTASRSGESVLDAPSSVTVITAEDIKKSGKTSVVQVLESVAGVRFTSASGESQAQVAMRGFGENSFGRVKVLVDGRELNNPDMSGINWLSIPISSIERIEIVDGPSGVLYGAGAEAGVINVITKEGAREPTAGATLSYGSNSTIRAQIDAGYSTETAGFTLAGDWLQTNGYRENSAVKDVNAALSGFIDLGDRLTLKPSFTYADIAYEMPGSLTAAQFADDPYRSYNAGDNSSERDIGGSLLALYQIGTNLSLEFPVDYLYKNRTAAWVSSYVSYMASDLHLFGARPRLTFVGDLPFAKLNLAGGLDWGGSLASLRAYSDQALTAATSDGDYTQMTYAPYVSAKLLPTDSLSLEAGARYSGNALTVADNLASENYALNSSAVVWDCAVNWRPTDGLSLYAKHNSLFGYPFLEQVLPYGSVYGGTYYPASFNANLVPETGYNFEVGGKARVAKAFSLDANAYCMLMDDEIGYNASTYANENLDPTLRLGGKLNAAFNPFEFATLSAKASYVSATFRSGANAGKSIPLVPNLTAGTALEVRPLPGASAGVEFSYVGDSWQGGDVANAEEKVPFYCLLGASARFEPVQFKGRFAISARADNLLDWQYASYVYGYTNSYTGAWVSGWYPAEGRSFTISATVRY